MDDVTGDPIRLSSAQREEWRKRTEEAVAQLIEANNAFYREHTIAQARIVELEAAHRVFTDEIKPALWRELGLLDGKIADHRALSLWGRLRWLVRGV